MVATQPAGAGCTLCKPRTSCITAVLPKNARLYLLPDRTAPGKQCRDKTTSPVASPSAPATSVTTENPHLYERLQSRPQACRLKQDTISSINYLARPTYTGNSLATPTPSTIII